MNKYTKDGNLDIEQIGLMIRQMIDKFEVDICTQSQSQQQKPIRGRRNMSYRQKPNKSTTDDTDAEDEINHFRRPYKELMIWAIIMNRYVISHLYDVLKVFSLPKYASHQLC